MTPQLQQAIKLLQLSNVELAEYCEAELERNPLLERDEAPTQPRRKAKAPITAIPAAERRPGAVAGGFLPYRRSRPGGAGKQL